MGKMILVSALVLFGVMALGQATAVATTNSSQLRLQTQEQNQTRLQTANSMFNNDGSQNMIRDRARIQLQEKLNMNHWEQWQ